jgi:hypothetical protein
MTVLAGSGDGACRFGRRRSNGSRRFRNACPGDGALSPGTPARAMAISRPERLPGRWRSLARSPSLSTRCRKCSSQSNMNRSRPAGTVRSGLAGGYSARRHLDRARLAGFGHKKRSERLLGRHSLPDSGPNPDSCSSQSNICELCAWRPPGPPARPERPDRAVERNAGPRHRGWLVATQRCVRFSDAAGARRERAAHT